MNNHNMNNMNMNNHILVCDTTNLEQLNNRIFNRIIPSKNLENPLDFRPCETRHTIFPTSIKQNVQPTNMNYNQLAQFNPGSKAPYSGYANFVDQESRIKNIFMTNQKWCGQTSFIPSSKSELYNEKSFKKTNIPELQKHSLLFQQETFSPFNPNDCNIGNQLFNNHTRQQTKDL